MYKSKVIYQIGSLYSGSVDVYHYNNLENNEIIKRAKRLLNYKGMAGSLVRENWDVISTDYNENH